VSEPDVFRIVCSESMADDPEVLKEWFVEKMKDAGGTPADPLNLTVTPYPGPDATTLWVASGFGYREENR
jgi:hypothetical protein